jgi:hypothetical protein
MRLRLLILLFGGVLAGAPMGLLAEPETPKAALTASDYEIHPCRGWIVHVEKALEAHPRRAAALELLEAKLAKVEELLPSEVVKSLKEVPFWLSKNVAVGACYHPSVEWLRANGRVVEMARSIELQNIDHFIDWEPTQPFMILHELAHAWHHRVLENGYENAEIRAAFEVAVASGNYEKVRRKDGSVVRHYALTNAMEYFAEATEAYFGRNDFEPFERAELLEFDKAAHDLVAKLWRLESP